MELKDYKAKYGNKLKFYQNWGFIKEYEVEYLLDQKALAFREGILTIIKPLSRYMEFQANKDKLIDLKFGYCIY